MAQQKQVKKTDTDKKVDEEKKKDEKPKMEKDKKQNKDLKKLIDEIDDILAEQGEDFVENYVQRGGE